MELDFIQQDSIDELYPPFDLTYQQFYNQYLVNNKPCILRGYLNHDNCPASTDWVKDGKPNLDWFLTNLPLDLKVPVSLCNHQYFNSQECVSETLLQYYEYWKSERKDSKYLKDWHFLTDNQKSGNSEYFCYSVPSYFCSDWLNEWLLNRKLNNSTDARLDYKFVYIGPKDSFTPFHSDVFGSFSWSANVVGIKDWIFLPPGEEKKVEISSSNYVYDILNQQSKNLQEKNGYVKMFHVEQNCGDVIFVPSGWFHQVRNRVDTISINHNWFNAANVESVFDNLNRELDRVQKEIFDCKDDPDWNYLCQNLLREHFGLNHIQFSELLNFIIETRLKQQSCNSDNLNTSDHVNENKDLLIKNDAQIAITLLDKLNQKLNELGVKCER